MIEAIPSRGNEARLQKPQEPGMLIDDDENNFINSNDPCVIFHLALVSTHCIRRNSLRCSP